MYYSLVLFPLPHIHAIYDVFHVIWANA